MARPSLASSSRFCAPCSELKIRLECSFSPLPLPYPSLSGDNPRCWVSLSLTKVNGIRSRWWRKVLVLQERGTQAWTRTLLSVKGTGLTSALLWWFLAIEIESQLKSLISNTFPRVLSNYFYAFLGGQFCFHHSGCSVRTTSNYMHPSLSEVKKPTSHCVFR